MNRSAGLLLSLLAVVSSGPARADTVIFRAERGTTDSVEAEQVTRVPEGWRLRVRGEDGKPIEMTLDAAKVVRIIPSVRVLSPAEIDARIAVDPRSVMDQMRTQWRADPNSRNVTGPAFQRALDSYLVKNEGLASSNVFDEALKGFIGARTAVDSPEANSILGAAVPLYQQRLDMATSQTRQAYSRFLANRAGDVLDREDIARMPQAFADLQAAQSLDPANAAAWLNLARFYRRSGAADPASNKKALDAADLARRYAVDAQVRARAQEIYSLAARDLGMTPAATPAPYVPPSPTPGRLPMGLAVTPAPAPPPPSRGAAPSWRSYWDRLITGDFGTFGDVFDRMMQEGYLPFLIGIPAFLILFWVIPKKFLRARARKGDVAASIWVTRTWLGLFALLGYLIGLVRLPRRAKETCPICKKAIDNIEDYEDFNFLVCPHCGENITPVHDLNDYIQHLVEQLEREVRHRRGQYTESTIEKDSTLKLVRAVITNAVRSRASDIHIDTEVEGATVKSRIDGVLYNTLFLPKPVVASVVSAIKVMAKLDIAERRRPQDGKMSMWVDKSDIDMRVNTSPAVHGEKVSMRLLDRRTITKNAADLGFEAQNLALFEQAIRRPHGMIIVTGPAGSGKSTTLYVALNSINTGEKNIITLEDPIEYEIKGLNQMEVNPSVDFTFATGLRTMVRQDPNVIMVGEVRDKETAEMAIETAITGHLVMTTMHTIDTTTVFTRLADMGIESRRYASALVLIIAQRLARLNCPQCRKPYAPDAKALAQLRLDQGAKDIVFLKGEGCPHCQRTGFYGRKGLFEIFTPDREMHILLEQNAASSKIREMARHKGMRNIREEGVLRIMRGLTTVEEVIRATM